MLSLGWGSATDFQMALVVCFVNLLVLFLVVRYILQRENLLRTDVILPPPIPSHAPAVSPDTHGYELVLMDDDEHGVFETLRASTRIPHTIRHNDQLFTHRHRAGPKHIYTRGLPT
jgi:hypothetical protein